jgi:DNA-binding MarR family transcriptional regulator
VRSRAEASAATRAVNGREHPGTRGLALGMLNASVGYMLRRAQLAVFADFGATLAELDLRPGQFAALMVIDRNRGVTQSEVCATLGIWRTNFVAVIDDLERRGLARRVSSPGDRRSKALALTAAGEQMLQRAAELQRAHETRVGRRLGPGGREQLLRILGQLAEGA